MTNNRNRRNRQQAKTKMKTNQNAAMVRVPLQVTPVPRVNRRRNATASKNVHFETMSFSLEKIVGNSSGCLKFGPHLEQSKGLTGMLAGFHQYKITSLSITLKSFASDQTVGSMAYELDTSCKMSSLSSRASAYPLKRNSTKTYGANVLNSSAWLDSAQDQFYLLYSGDGKSTDVVGQIEFRFQVHFQVAK